MNLFKKWSDSQLMIMIILMNPNLNQMKIQKSVKFKKQMINQIFLNRTKKMAIQNNK